MDGMDGDVGDDGSLHVSCHTRGVRTRRRKKPVVLVSNWQRDEEADGVGVKAPYASWVPDRIAVATNGSTLNWTVTFDAQAERPDRREIVRLRVVGDWPSPKLVRKRVSMAIWGVDWDGIYLEGARNT